MERAISGLPRRCEADAWEEEQRGLYRARRSVTISSSGFAHEPCCHSKNNKPLAKGKLGPAAEGNPPRGNNFRVREFVLQRKTNSVRGEKAFPWQSPSGALTAFELGNGTWSVPFPDRARSLPREKKRHDFK